MLNQENIYQLILKEEWKNVLDLLYNHKEDISMDSMLQQAAATFEQEFFDKVSDYSFERKDIVDNLETLYVLNHGNFYILSAEHYKTLIIEIVKRKPLNEVIDYARHFPDEEICKTAIIKYETQKSIQEGYKPTPIKNISMNLIEIYNRLFELINNQNDTATYYTGPKFINTVREFEPYFPDYKQFIEKRNLEGKSTSRKIFYYDILLGLKEETRYNVVNRILEIIKPFQKDKVEQIEELLGKKVVRKNIIKNQTIETSDNPKVFISYSWDNEEHKGWVLNLADRLCGDGIDIILDRYYLKPGKNLPHFVETSISKAERIIVVFTPNYKLKADKRDGGVGYEYSIMNADLYNNQTANEKIIPVLRTGDEINSIPAFMQQLIHIDIRNNDTFETSYVDLLREILNEPEIQKPKIGLKRTFTKRTTEEVEKPEIGNTPNFRNEDSH